MEPAGAGAATGPRILVAGIGNVFCADDGFGPEVIAALRARPLPPQVHAADFGIRGMDLAYRLLEGWHTALFVDAAPHGQPPGTVSVIEPEVPDLAESRATPQAHGMDPVQVLSLAAHLAEEPLPRVLVIGCEPEIRMTGEEPDVRVGLSRPVREAVEVAAGMVESLVAELLAGAGPMADRGVRAGQRPATVGEEVSSR
ncbi:hydrogenase maturation protease [Streptomyces palmae]|uniref:Hydrogenase maturation protease n=1 Tax=Streptomyces palmae TaxID=1701085 RepID=A0A4Z0HDH9_9ACTN|nr:hydrogenase maturation protease [Streptomyces palmae]